MFVVKKQNGFDNNIPYFLVSKNTTAISCINPFFHFINDSRIIFLTYYCIKSTVTSHLPLQVEQFLNLRLRQRVTKTKCDEYSLVLLKPMRHLGTPYMHEFLFVKKLYAVMWHNGVVL